MGRVLGKLCVVLSLVLFWLLVPLRYVSFFIISVHFMHTVCLCIDVKPWMGLPEIVLAKLHVCVYRRQFLAVMVVLMWFMYPMFPLYKCITNMRWYLLSVIVSYDNEWGLFICACRSTLDLSRIAAVELWQTLSTLCPGDHWTHYQRVFPSSGHSLFVLTCIEYSKGHFDFLDLIWLLNIDTSTSQ